MLQLQQQLICITVCQQQSDYTKENVSAKGDNDLEIKLINIKTMRI